jgi:hypothetical protein
MVDLISILVKYSNYYLTRRGTEGIFEPFFEE